jgi:S-DNA-T family DNA segregation ATPase FtsK/SpoIIIE
VVRKNKLVTFNHLISNHRPAMWLMIVIPIALLYVCFRLLFMTNKPGKTTPTNDLETHTSEIIPSIVDTKEVISLELKTIPETAQEIPVSLEEPWPPAESLPDYDPTLDLPYYTYPTLELFETSDTLGKAPDGSLETNKDRIVAVLKSFDIQLTKITFSTGPASTLYEIVPVAGVLVSRIKRLEDDLSLGLATANVRVISPIPGRGTIGIEVPHLERSKVDLRSLLACDEFQQGSFELPIAIGLKTVNEAFIVDLARLPHLLIGGAIAQGKSTALHVILASLLFKQHPSQLKLVLIDPRKLEMSMYRALEKHFLAKVPGQLEPVVTDPDRFGETLTALCCEMDNRFDLLKSAGAQHIKDYNDKLVKRQLDPRKGHQYLPYIVVAIEDISDLIGPADSESENTTIRLAEKGHTVGIHLIASTSRLSLDMLSRALKAQFPTRAAFRVTSRKDSRAILDEVGAESLGGPGDMLFQVNRATIGAQGTFIGRSEIDRLVAFIGRQAGYQEAYKLPESVEEYDLGNRDPLFEEAARLVVMNQLGSTSLIQRKMKLGYNRAGRLMNQLEEAGVVGPGMGSKPRDVLIKSEQALDQYLGR